MKKKQKLIETLSRQKGIIIFIFLLFVAVKKNAQQEEIIIKQNHDVRVRVNVCWGN